MTEVEKAYIAGMIDGEGCINFYKSRAKSMPRGYTYVARLQISNTNLELLTSIWRNLNERGHFRSKKQYGENNRAGYDLAFCPSEIREILPELLPYLRAKKHQAELMIEFLERSRRGHLGRSISEAEWNYRDELFNVMHKLNSRGIKEKGGELLGTPKRDNQQPSLFNAIELVDRKVHRLTGEEEQSNKPDTSAAPERDDIVGAAQ